MSFPRDDWREAKRLFHVGRDEMRSPTRTWTAAASSNSLSRARVSVSTSATTSSSSVNATIAATAFGRPQI